MEDPVGLAAGAGGVSFLASAFLSIAEGALSDFSWSKLEDIVRSKKKGDDRFEKYLKREDDIVLAISSLKVGVNLMFVLSIVVMSGGTLTRGWTYLAAAGAVAGIILIADVPAYLVGRRLAEAFLFRFLPMLNGMRFVVQPALWASRAAGEILARVFGSPAEETQAEAIADDILSAAAEGRREGVFPEEQHDMIEGVVRFRQLQISEGMTPRTDMISLPVDMAINQAVSEAFEHGHSRYPIFKENRDNIVGILHVRDLLKYWDHPQNNGGTLESLARPPYFIPQTKNLADLFEEMRGRKIQMAVVLDEYGGTAGIITVEDILEEIVGDIADEYETEEEEPFRRIDDRTAVVDGRLKIDDLNEKFDLDIPEDEDYETVGGLLLSSFGRVPSSGEKINLDTVLFTVTEADPRKVHKVQIVKEQAD